MKKIKYVVFSVIICFCFITTLVVVKAQETSKQLSNAEKIKTFLNTTSIEVIENYNEDNLSVYKVHDVDKNQYYKLAISNNNEVGWYDDIKYGDYSKISQELQNIMKTKIDEEKISVLVEMKFDYTSLDSELSKYNSRYFSVDGYKTDLSETEYINAKKIKAEYIKEKVSKVNVFSKKYEVGYISEYSPFAFLKLTKDQINEMADNDNVYSISYISDELYESIKIDSVSEAVRSSIMNAPITSTRTNVVKNAGKNGSGIKIGQVELALPDTSNSTLSGKAITRRNINCEGTSYDALHATEVASILVGSNGVAPSAELYSICANSDETLAFALDWFVYLGVDVVNISMGAQYKQYSQIDKYLDAISYMHDILFVVAAGNKQGVDPLNNVNTPGMAYNAITVGNITYQGTSYADAMNSSREETSSYNQYGFGQNSNKPDMVAPGTNINYSGIGTTTGNSFSAPLVAGSSALLMQQSSAAKDNFLVLKSALYATARPMNNYPKYITYNVGGFPTAYESINKEVGLGILDTKAASDLLSWGQYRSFTIDGGYESEYVYNNTLGNGMNVRVAITWSKPNAASGYNNITSAPNRVADLDLWILGPNGEKIVKSSSDWDNIEWVNFVTNSGYGSYKFKVVNYGAHSNTVPTKVAMAWW